MVGLLILILGLYMGSYYSLVQSSVEREIQLSGKHTNLQTAQVTDIRRPHAISDGSEWSPQTQRDLKSR
jgi:hypothetical protein